jgi:hypothetical protein
MKRCKYVSTFSRKGDAKRAAKELRRDGFRAKIRKHKGGVEVLSCGRKKR